MNLYTYVGNCPVNTFDPLGLWQFTLGGGWGWGGAISFSYNGGRFNLQVNVGFAAGAKVDLNPNDSGSDGMKSFAVKVGVKTSAEVKAGTLIGGEASLGEFLESDTCNNWHIKGALSGQGGAKIPFTPLQVQAGGATGPEIIGKGWSIDRHASGFYAESEGVSFGIGGMLFGGATMGISW